jgi:hypothetical protein
MQTVRALALPAAIFVGLFTGACQDAPFEPRPTASQPLAAPPTRLVGGRAFSGEAGDSVMDVLEADWARLGRPEYRQLRLDWRKSYGVPQHVKNSANSPRLEPNAILDGAGGIELPRIISHYEALRFGRHDWNFNIATAVEAEMTFIGDFGETALGALTITRKIGGSPYVRSGRIAIGGGEIVNCADVSFGGCDNRRHLGGVLILDGAPDCDAKGSGNVNYFVSNANSSMGIDLLPSPVSIGTNGSSTGGVASNGLLDMAAPPCNTDNVPAAPPPPPPDYPGGPVPDPQPWEPPPGDPAPPPAPGPVVFFCSGVVMSQIVGDVKILLAEAYVCYPG